MKPRILLLDEPLSALDGVIKESIKDRIKTIAREYHLTTIIVTHDPEEALTLSDRVLIIDQGDHRPVRPPGRDHPEAGERFRAEVHPQPAGDQAQQHLCSLREATATHCRITRGHRHETEILGAEAYFPGFGGGLCHLPGGACHPASAQVLFGGRMASPGLTTWTSSPARGSPRPWATALLCPSSQPWWRWASPSSWPTSSTTPACPGALSGFVQAVATLPMFLPTITYGFAIIYSFGKQGPHHPAAGPPVL